MLSYHQTRRTHKSRKSASNSVVYNVIRVTIHCKFEQFTSLPHKSNTVNSEFPNVYHEKFCHQFYNLLHILQIFIPTF